MQFNQLSPEEERIIVGKGTEAPYSGEYEKKFVEGIYLCRRCDAPLYESKNKFEAHCGWPSFDEEIKGAVKRQTDVDGMRTEVVCAACGAHLGHVFTGENMTLKNIRHCVNSVSLRFVPYDFNKEETPFAVLAGGCFWCLESVYKEVKGVAKVTSGYTGGHLSNPSYEQVSSGTTGHAEAVKIDFDPDVINFETLLEIFFSIHDPTTLNRQGSDIGPQYRSAIFYATWKQRIEAEKILQKLAEEKIYTNPIVTELKALIVFYPAEEYHQDYYAKNPQASYCQLVINSKLKKFREKFQSLLKE